VASLSADNVPEAILEALRLVKAEPLPVKLVATKSPELSLKYALSVQVEASVAD